MADAVHVSLPKLQIIELSAMQIDVVSLAVEWGCMCVFEIEVFPIPAFSYKTVKQYLFT